MNETSFDRTGTHLDGSLLEALASGTARVDERAFAQEHLNGCARCREELGAMSRENAGFDEYFRAEEAELLRRAGAERTASPRHALFFVASAMAAAAAAVAIAVITLFTGKGGPVDKTEPRLSVAEENPGPKQPPTPQPVPTPTVTPPAIPDPVVPAPTEAEVPRTPKEASTYQGKTAEEWLQILRTSKEPNLRSKAHDALARLGPEAIPGLMRLIHEGNAEEKENATRILEGIDGRKAVAQTIELLADPSWEIRLAAVQMLKLCIPQDDRAVAALQKALKDRDKAVAEAAEDALVPVKQRKEEQAAKARDLVTVAKTRLAEKNWQSAIQAYQNALAIAPDLQEAQVGLAEAKKMYASDAAVATARSAIPDPPKPEGHDKADLDLAKLKLDRSRVELDRLAATLRLQESQLKSDQESLDRANMAFENGALAKEDLTAQQDKVRDSEKAIVQTKADLKRCELDGEILRIELEKLQGLNR